MYIYNLYNLYNLYNHFLRESLKVGGFGIIRNGKCSYWKMMNLGETYVQTNSAVLSSLP